MTSRIVFRSEVAFGLTLLDNYIWISLENSTVHGASILRPALRDYGGQVAPAYAEAPADKHSAGTNSQKLQKSIQAWARAASYSARGKQIVFLI